MSAYYFNAAQGRGGSIAVDMPTFLPFLAYLRTRVEELRQVGALRYSVYLLYWYKSTYTDATTAAARCGRARASYAGQVLSLLALLVRKYTY